MLIHQCVVSKDELNKSVLRGPLLTRVHGHSAFSCVELILQLRLECVSSCHHETVADS